MTAAGGLKGHLKETGLATSQALRTYGKLGVAIVWSLGESLGCIH